MNDEAVVIGAAVVIVSVVMMQIIYARRVPVSKMISILAVFSMFRQ